MVGVVAVGILGTTCSSALVRVQAKAEAEEWLAERAEIVQSAIVATVGDLIDGTQAVAAFIETNENPSQDGFVDFVGRLDPRISLIGIAYVPVVPASGVDAFVSEMQASRPGFVINDLNLSGDVIPTARSRETYYPVQFFAPGQFLDSAVPPEEGTPIDIGIGVDAGSNEEWAAALVRTLELDGPVVSDFIPIAFEEIVIGQAFLITVPVHGDGPTQAPIGTVAAPMIDVLLPTELDVSIASDVTWEIGHSDNSADILDPATTWTGTVALPGVVWQLRVMPTKAASAGLAGTSTWLVWLLGLGITAVVAGFAEMVRQRSRSRLRLAQLQHLSEEKDRFLAAVSHEIRTPLTVVNGLAHELRDRPGDFSPDETRSLFEMVVEQSDEVAAIVDDLLVAARSDISKVAVHAEVVDLFGAVEQVVETTQVPARLVGSPPAAVWADARRVRQIVRNLLTNAQRYGGDSIEVRFATSGTSATVTVADDGSPIPQAHRDRIFDPYTSAHADAKKLGSIGLGLFISRKLSVLMGGNLSYRHDGKWSLFTLRLPLTAFEQVGPLGTKAPPSRARR